MSKQIYFLQAEADAAEFLKFCSELKLKVLEGGEGVKEVKFNWQYFLREKSGISIEYDATQLYKAEGETDILSVGRLYLETPATENALKIFERLRKFIRKKYANLDGHWLGVHAAEKVKRGEIIAAVNFGTLRLADENLNVVYEDTWLKNRRFVDGEWVDNTDIRYYR